MSDAAFRVWVCSFTYCARQRPITGFMTEAQAMALIRKLGKPKKVIDELVGLRGWERADGGYLVHDYEQYVERGSNDRVRQWREGKKQAGITESQMTSLREVVFARDGYACRYCGATPDRKQLVADHVIPTPTGPTTLENLVTACRSCNRRKGARTPSEAQMDLRPVTETGVTVTPCVGDLESHGDPSRARAPDGYPVPEPVPVPQSSPTSNSDPPTPLRAVTGVLTDGYEAFLAELCRSTGRHFRGDAISRGLYAERRQEGRTAAELEAAARGVALSKHHMGLNKLQVPLNDPKHVLDSAMLDTLIGLGLGEIGLVQPATRDEARRDRLRAWAARIDGTGRPELQA